MADLTHIDSSGNAHMVDVADREITTRTATAVGKVLLSKEVVTALRDGNVPKGDVLAAARIAGIMGTKRTSDLIEKLLPGIPEALRAYSRANVPTSDLSRGLAGVTGKSLIINLPGSPGAVRDGLVIIERLAGHVHDQLAGQDHSPSS